MQWYLGFPKSIIGCVIWYYAIRLSAKLYNFYIQGLIATNIELLVCYSDHGLNIKLLVLYSGHGLNNKL